MKTRTIEIKELSHSGHGIGYTQGQDALHVLGAFPGDIVEVQIYKSAEGINYAQIIKIVKASKDRIYTPSEAPFFDANAPWRYLEPKRENTHKKDIVHNLFAEYADVDISSEIKSQDNTTHYRNKAAYSFMLNTKGNLCFALYPRGTSSSKKIEQHDNILVHEMINKAGKQFLHFFNQRKVPLSILKYLVLRYSYSHNDVVAQILVTETNRKKLPWKKSDLETFIANHPYIKGVIVSHSEAGIRSSLSTKDFYHTGDISINEELRGKKYQYHPSQFFQIYPEAFANILDDCHKLVSEIPEHRSYELLDLFAGVGIIGIHLADLVSKVRGVEQSPLAQKYALINAKNNGIDNYFFNQGDVDDLLAFIQKEQILVIDPPRSGLSNKTKEQILEVQPKYIMYISCNPETQARDFKELQKAYDLKWSQAYNLFPKTSHVEHLIFLKRIN